MNLKVVLQEAQEGGYIVSCPALPGCHSQGDNAEEALKNIKEAIVLRGIKNTQLLLAFKLDGY